MPNKEQFPQPVKKKKLNNKNDIDKFKANVLNNSSTSNTLMKMLDSNQKKVTLTTWQRLWMTSRHRTHNFSCCDATEKKINKPLTNLHMDWITPLGC